MALLTPMEQQLCVQQGAWGATQRCDNPACNLVILQPVFWVGSKHRVYHSRECKETIEGGNYSKHIKKRYRDGAAGASGVIPFMGSDVDRIEQEIMKQVIANPHTRWNFSTIAPIMKGTDRPAIRQAIHNLLDDQSLYKIGLTMSILKPEAFIEVRKERKQEERLHERMKRKRARKRERMRLKEEKRLARIAAKEARVSPSKGPKPKATDIGANKRQMHSKKAI